MGAVSTVVYRYPVRGSRVNAVTNELAGERVRACRVLGSVARCAPVTDHLRCFLESRLSCQGVITFRHIAVLIDPRELFLLRKCDAYRLIEFDAPHTVGV